MDWYYEFGGSQHGPVADSELGRLSQTGAINGATRVWNETLSDWTPLSAAAPHLAPAAPAAPARSQNPYASPQSQGAPAYGQLNQGDRLPGFVKGWMITDIVFCSFHLIAVLIILGLIGQHGAPPGVILIDFFLSMIIGIFGLIAAIMILSGKSGGVGLGWLTFVATAGSIVFSLIKGAGLVQSFGMFPGGSVVGSPVMVVVLFGVLARGTLVVFYVMALNRASQHFSYTRSQTRRRY